MNIPFLFVVVITVATVALGIWATRQSRTAGDFFVAGRSVNVFWNAGAISGEYLSAASFMGIAGMLMKNGYDVLWYPVCYATGYLFLLLFIAGPLRRFGAYTIPDFAEGRFDSPLFRRIAVTFVLFIGFFYTMPQMKGAGVTMTSILGWPYWAGIAVVGSVITFNVALGGMKGITLVQAFQYWAKVFAISLPVFILMSVYGGYHTVLGSAAEAPKAVPTASAQTPLELKGEDKAPNNVLAFGTSETTRIRFPRGAVFAKLSTSRKAQPGEDPVPASAVVFSVPGSSENGFSAQKSLVDAAREGAPLRVPPGALLEVRPFNVTKVGSPVLLNGSPVRTSIRLELKEKTTAVLEAGSPIPNAPPNRRWLEPFGTLSGKYGLPLLYTYSLILALVCGTAGLPHILVRFYTNPDGRAAKRTTLWVMVMIGTFYLFPPIWGALGRAAMPMLYATNATDSVVIKLPVALQNQTLGQVLSGITSAGAFAAFMSTFSGLLVSMSGAMAHDIYGRILRPHSTPQQRLTAFKVAAVVFGAASMGLGILVETYDINMMVGWAFAIAAASYFPLLLLGSWWRGLTKYGAAAGMLSGGLLSLAAIIGAMLLEKKVLSADPGPVARTLLEQPAIWGVPLALAVMFVVSKCTASKLPGDVHLKMLRLHAPEQMGLSKDYIEH